MASKIPIQPGQTYIGFMKTDGTLIGSLAKPSLGHDLLASLKALAKRLVQ
jgi:hypothetical protein